MKAFTFRLGQRINVPGRKGVQGIIGLPTHTGEMHMPITGVAQAPLAHHAFFVRFLLEDGTPACAWFGDFDLAFANPEAPAPEASHAGKVVVTLDADTSQLDRKLRGVTARITRVRRAATRKPSSPSPSRRMAKGVRNTNRKQPKSKSRKRK